MSINDYQYIPGQCNMKLATHYPLVIKEQDTGGYSVLFPDFPDVVIQADTRKEALKAAADSLKENIYNRISNYFDNLRSENHHTNDNLVIMNNLLNHYYDKFSVAMDNLPVGNYFERLIFNLFPRPSPVDDYQFSIKIEVQVDVPIINFSVKTISEEILKA